MKYIVYKGFAGLVHMLRQINRSIILSEVTKRYLIIDTNTHAFKHNFNDFFTLTILVIRQT